MINKLSSFVLHWTSHLSTGFSALLSEIWLLSKYSLTEQIRNSMRKSLTLTKMTMRMKMKSNLSWHLSALGRSLCSGTSHTRDLVPYHWLGLREKFLNIFNVFFTGIFATIESIWWHRFDAITSYLGFSLLASEIFRNLWDWSPFEKKTDLLNLHQRGLGGASFPKKSEFLCEDSSAGGHFLTAYLLIFKSNQFGCNSKSLNFRHVLFAFLCQGLSYDDGYYTD